jgi:hypothetical protein
MPGIGAPRERFFRCVPNRADTSAGFRLWNLVARYVAPAGVLIVFFNSL